MSTASERTIQALEQVVKDVPVGTDLALVHLLWAMLSGAFLHSHGAVFSALQWASDHLGEHEVAIHDAGASVADMQEAHMKRYVVRTDLNCAARRDHLPPRKRQGRPPEYGQKVRPLPRQWKNRTIAATKPDFTTSFPFDGRTVAIATATPLKTRVTIWLMDLFEVVFIIYSPEQNGRRANPGKGAGSFLGRSRSNANAATAYSTEMTAKKYTSPVKKRNERLKQK